MSYLKIPPTMTSDYDVDEPMFNVNNYEYKQDLVLPITDASPDLIELNGYTE